ncbi:MAG: TIGR03087 family PEP-CTERM/XrtA system glycosyltransferase [bacterium]
MKILYLAHRIPYPPNKGDKIRSFNEIKWLSKKHQIYLCCLADNPEDLHYGDDLLAYCQQVKIVPVNPRIAKLKSVFALFSGESLSIPYFYAKTLQTAVDHLLATVAFDCILCFSSPMAEYIFRSPALGRRSSGAPSAPRLVMDFCDVDSDKWLQYGQTASFPLSRIYRLEGRRLARYERKTAEFFDHSVVISQKEAEIFQTRNPHICRLTVIANGVDYHYFDPDELHPLPPDSSLYSAPGKKSGYPVLLFTGAMDYHANADGVIWFSKEIFPMIRKAVPEVRFYIVGSNPGRKVRALDNGDTIRVTGFVEDVRPYYQRADICVIPLRLGRGVQNKVLEAMAMGRAIVTTSKTIEGIHAVPGEHLLVGNDQDSISRATITLLEDEDLRAKLGARARQQVRAWYNWSACMEKLESLLQEGHDRDLAARREYSHHSTILSGAD